MSRFTLHVAAICLLLAACWADISPEPVSAPNIPGASADPGAGDETSDEVTYQRTIRPIMEANCVQCHSDGGIGPFPLTSYQEVREAGPEVVTAVESYLMPPWQPSDDCHPLRDVRGLTEAEREAFTRWGQGGRQEGDPADYVAPTPADTVALIGPPGIVTTALSPYTPNRNRPDDYRCLPTAHEFETDTYIVATNVVPQVREMVHHVIFFLIPPEQTGAVEALDARSEVPGYICFGASGIPGAVMIGGWVPGAPPVVWPESTAIKAPAGSQLVAQIHYNFVNIEDDAPVPSDLTEFHFWTLPQGEVPENLIELHLLADLTISIEAGDPASVHQIEVPVPFTADLVGALPHMHLLGSSIRVEHIRAGGSEQCVVDIPDWDFDWQQLYLMPDDQPIPVRPGDRVRLTCEYDNTAANQPIVNGERLTPRRVGWGEGTFDEMCLVYFATSSPFQELAEGVCSHSTKDCFLGCDEGDSNCGLACILSGGEDCISCFLNNAVGCGERYCIGPLLALGACYENCDGESCLLTDCVEPYDTFYDCVEPHLVAGDCDEDLLPCDVSFSD